MKIRVFLLIFFVNALIFKSFAQSNYYINDSIAAFDVDLRDWGEKYYSNTCIVYDDSISEVIRYTPYDIKEYGFRDGSVFISGDVVLNDSVQRVFLERMEKGKISLYRYYKNKSEGTFFVAQDHDTTRFVELSKLNKEGESYKQYLEGLMSDCDGFKDIIRFAKFNEVSLKKTVKQYNQCDLTPLPHFRYGIVGGYELMKLDMVSRASKYMKAMDMKYEGGFTIGAFVDFPIHVSNISLHVEGHYTKHSYSYSTKSGILHTQEDPWSEYRDKEFNADFLVNISSLKVPIMLRYIWPLKKVRPFVNAGVIYTYDFYKNNYLYETVIEDGQIEMIEEKSPLVSKNHLGMIGGAGLEFKMNPKNSLFLEFRYSYVYALSKSTFNNTIMQVLTGISF